MQQNSFYEYLISEKRYSNHTVLAYKSDLEQFFNFLFQTYEITKPEAVSPIMIRSWISALIEQGISARSINRKLSSLKTFYRFLRTNGYIKTSPLQQITAPKTNKRLPQFVNKESMELFLGNEVFGDDFTGKRDQIIIELLYNTGMRLAELTNLKITDIDLSKSELKVIGKRNKERIIPFNQTMSQKLSDFITKRQELAKQENEDQYLLLTKSGKKIYPKLVYRVVNSYLSKVSTLKKKSPHVLRHTFATHMLNNGADLNAIKEILGHANLSATQVYTHNTIENLKKVYKQAHPRA